MSPAPDRLQPYDALPPLPPAGIETVAVLRAVTAAARVLAELNGCLRTLPDPSLLLHAIPLQEAQASLGIENIVTTQDALFQAAITGGVPDDAAVREALRYRSVLGDACERLPGSGLTTDLLVQVCSDILDQCMTLRDYGDFVHLRDAAGAPVYTPPSGGLVVCRLMADLEDFLTASGNDLDPLLRMAIAHYQFEAIHPFGDGNGRTGRVLNQLVLHDAGVLDWPVLYLSQYIIERKDDYYRLLADVTFHGAWEPWLLWLLAGVETTARRTIERVDRIARLRTATADRLAAEAPNLLQRGILEVLFNRPTCKVAVLVEAGIAKRQTAAAYLKQLQQMGILAGEKHGREVIYRHAALIEALK